MAHRVGQPSSVSTQQNELPRDWNSVFLRPIKLLSGRECLKPSKPRSSISETSSLDFGPDDSTIRKLLAANLPLRVGSSQMQYSTNPCVLHRSPLVEVEYLSGSSEPFFVWQHWGREVRFSWFKPSTDAWLDFRDERLASTAYTYIWQHQTVHHKFMNPKPGEQTPIWTIYLKSLEPHTTTSDVWALLPRRLRPDFVRIGSPRHLMGDEEVAQHIREKLDVWSASEPTATYTLTPKLKSKSVDNPLRELVATFQQKSHLSRCPSQETEFAYSAMHFFLKSVESVNVVLPVSNRLKMHYHDQHGRVYKQVQSAIPSIHIYRHCGVQFNLPIRFGRLISQELAEFQTLCKGCYVQMNDRTEGRGNQEREIIINSHDVMNLTRARSALSFLLQGSLIHVEKVTSDSGRPLYNRWFETFNGRDFLRKVEDRCNVYIHLDEYYKRITVHGPNRENKEAHILLYDKLFTLTEEESPYLVPKIMDKIVALGGGLGGDVLAGNKSLYFKPAPC